MEPVIGRDGKLTNDHPYISAVVVLSQRFGARDRADAWWKENTRIREQQATPQEQALAALEAAPTDWGPDDEYFRVGVL